MSFAYAGGKSSPHIEAPTIQDTYIVHSVVDGFALGEILACSKQHPMLPTLNSVTAGVLDTPLPTRATARRFASDLNAKGTLEHIEFAWLEDSRVAISYRWTTLHPGMPFIAGGGTNVYPPSEPGQLPAIWEPPEVSMTVTGQVCAACGASHTSQCQCEPCVVEKRDPGSGTVVSTSPVKGPGGKDLTVASSWSTFCSLVSTCRTMGSFKVSYKARAPLERQASGLDFETPKPVDENQLAYNLDFTNRWQDISLCEGIAHYGICMSPGFPGVSELRSQIQVYMDMTNMSFSLLEEPKTDFEAAALLLTNYAEPEASDFTDDYTALDDRAIRDSHWVDADEDDHCLANSKPPHIHKTVPGGLRTATEAAQPPRVDKTVPGGLNRASVVESCLESVVPTSETDHGTTLDISESPLSVQRRPNSTRRIPIHPPLQEPCFPVLDNASASESDEKQLLQTPFSSSCEERRPHSSAHTDKPSTNTVCNICGAKFTRVANLKRHYNTIHLKVRQKRYSCTKCDRAFFNAVELKRHAAKHNKPRPECPHCGLRFRLTSALELHVSVVHAHERPFKCECGIAFARKSALSRHIRSVHQRQRYECAECNASYSQPFDLKMHQRRSGHDKSTVRTAVTPIEGTLDLDNVSVETKPSLHSEQYGRVQWQMNNAKESQ